MSSVPASHTLNVSGGTFTQVRGDAHYHGVGEGSSILHRATSILYRATSILYRATSILRRAMATTAFPNSERFDRPDYTPRDGIAALTADLPRVERSRSDVQDLARRPRDWRPDYTPRDGIAALTSYLPRVGRSRSDVQELADPVRRTLNPFFIWEPQAPPIYFDLRYPSFLPNNIHFNTINRPHNHIDLAQLACQPSSLLLRISHPRLPWYIDVHQVLPNGVTVNDIFEQIHGQLHMQIQDRDFYNEELNETDRSHLTEAFNARVGRDPRLRADGVLRVDFLGDKCVFEGLVRGPRGTWEMKTTWPQP